MLRPALREMTPSATVAINERSNEMIRGGQTVYKLGLGQSPFPVPGPVVEALRQHAGEKDYLPVAGLRALREAVAAYHRRQGLAASADDVLIGPGSKELMFLLQLVFAGDLMLPSPSWVSYEPQAALIGKSVRWIETTRDSGWRLEPDALARAIADGGRGSLLILNYPNNPSGVSYTSDELEKLAAIARDGDVIVLSDEIYGELHFGGEHHSIAHHYPERTIVSGGLSKWCGAGGWRLGTFLVPPSLSELRDAIVVAASETFTSVSAPIQHAAITAYMESPELESYLTRSRAILAALARFSAETLSAAGIVCPAPEGGFYLLIDFGAHRGELVARGVDGGLSLCEDILERKSVACLPGSAFGRPAGELTARIALVDFDGDAALRSDAAPDEAFLRTHCGNVVTAIEALAAYVGEL